MIAPNPIQVDHEHDDGMVPHGGARYDRGEAIARENDHDQARSIPPV